jgi:hypothetical protein
MKIYILNYTEVIAEINDADEIGPFYMPTKKAALAAITEEKKRFPENKFRNIQITELEIEANKAGLCDALNREVGTGY